MNKKIMALFLICCIVGSCVSSVSANSFTLTSYVSKSVHVWVISNGQNTFDSYFNSYKDSKWVNVHDDGTYYIYLNEYWKPGHDLKFGPFGCSGYLVPKSIVDDGHDGVTLNW